jgi:YVTN family beta-propeller protein
MMLTVRLSPMTGPKRSTAMTASFGLLVAAALSGCSRPTGGSATETAPGPRVYVSNEAEGSISIIDATSNRFLRSLAVGKRPRGIRVSRNGSLVYVALSGSPIAGPAVDESKLPPPDRSADGIGVVDTAKGKLLRVLTSGTDPEQFALSTDEKRLFVANEDAGQLSVVDVESGAVIKTIPVGEEPEGVELTPDGRHVYVTSEGENQVSVIDVERLERVASITVGARPRSTAFLPDGSRAYVSAENDGAIYVIDARRHEPIGRTLLGQPRYKPMGIAVARDGSALYVTTGRGEDLVRISLTPNAATVTGAIRVGARPWGIAISDDGKTLFTANGPSNDVSVIDTARMTVRDRVPVGDRPWGIAFSQK